MPKLLAAHQAVSLVQLLLFTLVRTSPSLFASFGFPAGQQPALGAFLLFNAVIGPFDEVSGAGRGGRRLGPRHSMHAGGAVDAGMPCPPICMPYPHVLSKVLHDQGTQQICGPASRPLYRAPPALGPRRCWAC